MVSKFFHKIFRINVELNFDLKFLSGILSHQVSQHAISMIKDKTLLNVLRDAL